MAVFCTQCVLARHEACLQVLRRLSQHNWKGILYLHDRVLWLAPELHMFQCSSIGAIADYFNAISIGDADRARWALQTTRNISLLIDKPGVTLVPIDAVPQLPPVRSPRA